jgi:hypothetical protein
MNSGELYSSTRKRACASLGSKRWITRRSDSSDHSEEGTSCEAAVVEAMV